MSQGSFPLENSRPCTANAAFLLENSQPIRVRQSWVGFRVQAEFIDYKTSMNRDKDFLRGLLFLYDLDFSHTLYIFKEMSRRCRVTGLARLADDGVN